MSNEWKKGDRKLVLRDGTSTERTYVRKGGLVNQELFKMERCSFTLKNFRESLYRVRNLGHSKGSNICFTISYYNADYFWKV